MILKLSLELMKLELEQPLNLINSLVVEIFVHLTLTHLK